MFLLTIFTVARACASLVIFAAFFLSVVGRPAQNDASVKNATMTPGVSPSTTGGSGNITDESGKMDMELAKQVWMLSDKVWNLNQCPSGIQIRIGRRRLNKKHFYCTKHDAMNLAPMLLGDSLEDRMYVWCRMAELYAGAVDTGNASQKTFEVKQLHYFEGDIILARENVDLILAPYFQTPGLQKSSLDAALEYRMQKSARRQKRKSAIGLRAFRWPYGEVNYSYDEKTFGKFRQQLVSEAISILQEATCIRFTRVPLGSRKIHVEFKHSNFSGCASDIGRRWDNKNTIVIGEGCAIIGIVLHEICHTLGFYHEQSRPDRDEFVRVDPTKFHRWNREHFLKTDANSHGVPYDYSSVMHFGSTDFGNGSIVLHTRDPEMQKVIGQRVYASFMDIKLMNIVYCSDACGKQDLNWEECKNGGYRNPNTCDTCICPRGLAPPFCEQPSDEVNADCGNQELIATEEEKVLTSPGFVTENGIPHNAFCPWLITASSAGKRVRLQFKDRFHIYQDPKLPVCEDSLEVRYKNITMAGPRFCEKTAPTTIFRSHGPQILLSVSTLNQTDSWQGFKAVYAEENCGGCSDDAVDEEPACIRTVEYICPDRCQNGISLWCNRTARNPCFRDEMYCCDGFDRREDTCVRSSNISQTPTPTASLIKTETEATRSTKEASTTTTVTTAELTSSTTKSTSRITKPTLSTTEARSSTSDQTSPTTESTSPTTEPTSPTTESTSPATEPTSPTTDSTSPPTEATSPKTEATTSTLSTRSAPTTQFPFARTLSILFPKRKPPTSETSNGWWSWSSWSRCTEDCGLCGERKRSRMCLFPPCRGPREQVALCGSKPCEEGITSFRYRCTKTKADCLRQAMRSGQPSNNCEFESICDFKKTIPVCCHGEEHFGECRILLEGK